MSANRKPGRKIRTKEELLIIAMTATRYDEDCFDIPSESTPDRVWRVNVVKRFCRDHDGKGCIPMLNYYTCKHYEAALVAIEYLNQWSVPYGN
jgi:hypothetical protein